MPSCQKTDKESLMPMLFKVNEDVKWLKEIQQVSGLLTTKTFGYLHYKTSVQNE